MKFVWNVTRRQYTIYCLWTDATPMSLQRRERLDELRVLAAPCSVVLITPATLPMYVRPDMPLHPAYPYLSAVHKADYLRCYLMHVHGGGYSDIKTPYGWPWYDAFRDFELNPRAMINIRHPGTAMICRPGTELTREWYTAVCKVLDDALPALKAYPQPAPPYVSAQNDERYPIGWTSLLYDILGPLCTKYAADGYVMTTVPMVYVHNHR
jgi:hypothetical protein